MSVHWGMYIEIVPNRTSPPAVLLRESYREDGRVKKRTLTNLSMLPMEVIELLREALKGREFTPVDGGFEIIETLPHGHVAAVTGIMKTLGMATLLGGGSSRERDLVMAMIASRIIHPASKLATSRLWNDNTIGETFAVAEADKDELYPALDWLLKRQGTIEKRLAKKHLADGSLVLYDLTSSYVEGRKCSLARHGYSRDHRPDRMQIEFGLVTDREGRPVAVEVFEGNTADPATLGCQVAKLKERFGLRDIVVVGDRGMVTTARIEEDLKPNGLSWISALRHDGVRKLAEGPLQLGLFDERNFAEISSPDYPDERLVACRNPNLARESTRKRNELMALTEAGLAGIEKSVENGRLCACGAIGRKVEAVLKRRRMTRYYTVEIAEGRFSWQRDEARLAADESLDGIYVLRSSVPEEDMEAAEIIRRYKSLAHVERAFRTIKSDLDVRPIFHYAADRVRAHIFLCMLAYYVTWEMRKRLAPLLFSEERPEGDVADPVAPKEPSEDKNRKTGTRRSKSGFGLHDFKSLLKKLGTLARNHCRILPDDKTPVTFTKLTEPSPTQKEAFRLLQVAP